jgi:hypothetical protein
MAPKPALGAKQHQRRNLATINGHSQQVPRDQIAGTPWAQPATPAETVTERP